MTGPQNSKPVGRQRRPKVPDALRKRAARACNPCRYHKEKCQGGVPCLRCQRYKRNCQYSQAPAPAASSDAARASASPQQASEKERYLEQIVRHFMGDISFEPSNLQFVADALQRDRVSPRNPSALAPGSSELYSIHPLSTSTMLYSGEFSHWNFSRMIRRKLQSLGNDPDDSMTGDSHIANDPFRATGLQSSSSIVASSRTYFPPRHIAEFLLDTFLEYTQTNYYYFDETEFRQKLDYYYTEDRYLDINDAGWICTLFMTFASGTQFAYMHASRSPYLHSMSGEGHLPDDTIGLALYRFSCRLIPDLITTASVETVQAFLLFGVYTMPIDTSGLAYTYLGLAIKMAIQNGMHRRFGEEGLDARTIELRNRLWWSAYTLDRRISILHGRPVSVSPTEIDCDMPKDLPDLRPSGRITNLPNITATIQLTEQLAKVAPIISRLRNCPGELHSIYLKQLLHVRDELRSWWETLPQDVHCRDLDPSKPLFRYNVHLELTYAMIIMYMGRPLILAGTPNSSVSDEGDSGSTVDASVMLCTDCVQAALRIVELCQLLQDAVGVARVSYTEFSSCRAALLAIIAQSLNTRTERLRGALTQGMVLIRRMCVGLQSARSEVAVIEALERAAQRLDSRTENEDTRSGETSTEYSQFRRWAMLWQSEPPSASVGIESEPIGLESSQLPAASFDGFFSSFPQELGAFASFPEVGAQFGENLPTMLWPDELSLPAFVPNPDSPT
ncbi:Zn(II)2Cys6 transcription factor [Aspergillus alliaceus]|uniref:Zn(II)2Cys6 transcription factor n=1 Tax=Petromyces alliaceus TaxID=209559 RepID=UPI0012A407AF|nr:fungal-specific transcription factor domain-containing protein [Aspergillus alliaceus]KAB8236200.1 fungal-specific transcription factor domain-containing protein [Aspergillus alliaceus]